MIEVKAEARNIRLTPRKARLVMDLVRGQDIDKALNTLKMVHKKAAPLIEGVIKSAVANAVHNDKLDKSKLIVTQAFINAGPLIKRMRPRARGRADIIHKKLSHLTIFVGERKES